MSILIVLLCIALLILLISQLKVNAFLAFLIISVVAGFLLGMDPTKIPASVEKGLGDMLASLVIVVICGAMLGKLAADSGAAQQIASGLMKLFGERYIQWALMVTGFIIGIPLFYNVGFVLVMPLIFSVAYRYKLPAVYIGLPILAALSVTHGFLRPHPSPTGLVKQLNASMGTTLYYGILIGFPTVILAGLVFSRTLKDIITPDNKKFQSAAIPDTQLPGLGISMFSSLLPVLLLALTALAGNFVTEEGPWKNIVEFLGNSSVVMIISLVIVTYTLGLRQGMNMKKVMDIYGDAVKDVGMIVLIMGGAGALKQILNDSGTSKDIAALLNGMPIHPLILGWLMASVIRVCVGSATVAGLTTSGIIAPLMAGWPEVNPNLMVLSIGAGSLMFSHVNDAGFWLFKEYFQLSIRQTIRSWSMMETIVAVGGLAGVMLINLFV